MAYTQPFMVLTPVGTGVLGVETVSAAAAVHGEYIIGKQCKIKRIMFVVTTAVAASVTAPVVAFKKRTASGVTAAQVTLGTLTLPTGTAVGQVLYKEISPVVIAPGEVLALEHVTQAVDGSAAAGAGYYMFELCDDPETVGNQSHMVLSV